MFLCIGVKKFSEPLQMSLTLHDYGLRSVSPLRASSDTHLRAAKTFFQVCFHLTCGEKKIINHPTLKNALFCSTSQWAYRKYEGAQLCKGW